MTPELRSIGARIERCTRALAQAIAANDTWAITQNERALRFARVDYARQVRS